MRRVFLVLLLFSFAVIPIFSQTNNHPPKAAPIKPPEAGPPTIRGLKLGMTADELLAVFHAANDIRGQLQHANGYPHFGLLQLVLEPGDEATRERFKGIAACFVMFFDGHVSSIFIRYASFPQGADWYNIDTLITKFSEAFGLPEASKWEVEPDNDQTKLFKGNGFTVHVSITGGGSVGLYDSVIDGPAQAKERSAAYHEERRRAFKP